MLKTVVPAISFVLVSLRIEAQGPVHPELRADLIASSVTSLHAGVALTVPAGTYTRFAISMGGGPAWSANSAGTSGHADAILRFHLDPFREERHGWYGWGGLGVLYDEFRGWRQLIVAGAGIEITQFQSRNVWALEIGVGGGTRLGLALRRIGARRR